MTQTIKWSNSPIHGLSLLSEPITPFNNGQIKRPIRITLHNEALKSLPNEEKTALEVLKNFASVESPNLLFLGTEPGDMPFIEIGTKLDGNYFPVKVEFSKKHEVHTGIKFVKHYPDFIPFIVTRLGGCASDHKQALQDIMVADAHHSLDQDLLVTTSKWLLGNMEIGFIDKINPCLPSEAVKIMGLMLRTRNDFRYDGDSSFNKGLFYWILTRYKLPSMWRYFNACVLSGPLRGDNIERLGESILVRCERAIQARDEIGKLFYIPQNNDTRDDAMYHFDYMVLLLSGALDAQARVIYRAYKLTSPNAERKVNFREPGFMSKVSMIDDKLATFLNGDYFKDISMIVSRMRNTIHGAGITTLAYQNGIDPEKSYARISEIDQQVIWDACEKYGSGQHWGLVRLGNMIAFEPYEFSQRLLEHALIIINIISSLTQVEKLFPSDAPAPQLTEGPPTDDHLFGSEIGERLALLAGL